MTPGALGRILHDHEDAVYAASSSPAVVTVSAC